MRVQRWISCAIAGPLLLVPKHASAQATGQLWANVTLDWVKSSRLTYEVDFEPKVLISAPPGEPGWRNLDVTPNVDFAMTDKISLVGELIVGKTKQTDDLDTTELTGRIGARFELFSRQERLFLKERRPKRRLVLRDLVRVELRNLFYSDDRPTESVVRLRNRLEFLFPLNRPNLADDGTIHLISDWEWFIPVSDPGERFANRQRIRAGFGFRKSATWRYVALYMWTRSRDTTSEPFTTSENIFNVQIKRVWQ